MSDDRLDKNIRKYIAEAVVTFRHSLNAPLPSELHYDEPSIILTEAPAVRVDPPQSFTAFVTLLVAALFVVFLWGLGYQKANLNLFPSDGVGLIVNGVFLGLMGVVLFMLWKFWVSWTFI